MKTISVAAACLNCAVICLAMSPTTAAVAEPSPQTLTEPAHVLTGFNLAVRPQVPRLPNHKCALCRRIRQLIGCRAIGRRAILKDGGLAAESCDPYEAALLHPAELEDHELAWFRAHPEARKRLLARLAEPTLEDDAPARILLWTLLEKQVLMPSEIAAVLEQAFNLVTRTVTKKAWWLFRLRTAPQFVYIRPQMWVYLRDGEVAYAQAAKIRGNGVEVFHGSKGAAPFLGRFRSTRRATSLPTSFVSTTR